MEFDCTSVFLGMSGVSEETCDADGIYVMF